MLHNDPRDPPSELWRKGADGRLYIGRRSVSWITSHDGKITLYTSLDELNDWAKTAWMIGWNAKAEDVADHLRRAVAGFDEIKNLLPVGEPVSRLALYAKVIWAVVAALIAVPVGSVLGSVLYLGVMEFARRF